MLVQEKTEGCVVSVKGDRCLEEKSKPTNSKSRVRRVQNPPFAGDDRLPKNPQKCPLAGFRRLPKSQRELLNAGCKSLVILALCPRFLLCREALTYGLPGSG